MGSAINGVRVVDFLGQTLQSAGVPWSVVVEASGWELMMRFVQFGVGLAIVNACCTVPKELKRLPVSGFPMIHYHLFHLKGAVLSAKARQLCEDLCQHANTWEHS